MLWAHRRTAAGQAHSPVVRLAELEIRLLETYSDEAAYEGHLQSAHFRKYKVLTQSMVKSLKLVETEPILLGLKLR